MVSSVAERDTEAWLPAPRFPNYQVSSHGRVRRAPECAPKTGAPRSTVRCPSLNRDGYPHLGLRNAEGYRTVPVHVLVCEAFHGPRPSPEHQVAHADGCRTNARPENLRWATTTENHADRRRHGTIVLGEKIPWSKLTEKQVSLIKDRLRSGESPTALAIEHGVSEGAISGIKNGKNWKHVAPASSTGKPNQFNPQGS
jgi:hypothetical protein